MEEQAIIWPEGAGGVLEGAQFFEIRKGIVMYTPESQQEGFEFNPEWVGEPVQRYQDGKW